MATSMNDDLPATVEKDALVVLEVVTEEKAQAALEILKRSRGDGKGTVNLRFLTALATVGKYGKGQGWKDLTRGALLRKEQILGEEIQAIQHDIQNLETANPDPDANGKPRSKRIRDEIDRQRQRLGDLCDKSTKNHLVMLQIEGTLVKLPEDENKPPTAQSFPVGQAVGPGTTIISQHTTVNAAPESPKPVTPLPAA